MLEYQAGRVKKTSSTEDGLNMPFGAPETVPEDDDDILEEDEELENELAEEMDEKLDMKRPKFDQHEADTEQQ